MNLTFLNGAFLFAALAALLPLLIHLISRRKVATVEFSSLRFLKELERKRIRRVRLRQILLLIIRSLIILAAALALARPTLKGTLGGGSHARTSVAVVLDDSASMTRSRDGGDLLSEARSAALEIAGLLDEGDQAFLVTASSPTDSRLAGGTFSPDVLVDAVDDVTATASATDCGAAVDLARQLLSDSRNLNRELYLLGDLQRTGWHSAAAATVPESAGDDDAANVAEPRAYVLPFTGPVANLAISSMEVERRHGGSDGSFSVKALVSNHGARATEALLRLVIDGEQVGQAGVVVTPGGTATARFAVTVDESEWHAGSVELPPDALEVDNVHHFVIPSARRTEVLLVRPDESEELDDADYIARALDPTSSGERFRVSVVTTEELARQDTERFPVVMLADVGRLDGGGERWLTSHLERGGGVLLVLGSRTDVRFWNSEFMPGLARAEIVAPIERRDGVRLAPASQGHPMLEGLISGERLIDDVSASRAFGVRAEGAEVVLELPGLGPALFVASGRASGTTSTIAVGEVAVLTTGIDPDWSDLPRSGLIVPLTHRLAERLSRTSAGAPSTHVGEDLVVSLSGPPSGRVDVETPDGRTVAAQLRSGRRPAASVERVDTPGVYRFHESGRTVALGAVNVDPRESDLRPLDRDDVENRFPGMSVSFIDPDAQLADEVLQTRYGRELWRVMLYAALALLALEMFVARTRFA